MKKLIEIPDGERVGEYIKNQLIQNTILNSKGNLKEDLEVRVFDRKRVSNLLSLGTDRNDLITWAWPYYPDTWSYNDVIADSNSDHPGGFAFYRKDGIEYIEDAPGKRKFIKHPYESLVAVFKYKGPLKHKSNENEISKR